MTAVVHGGLSETERAAHAARGIDLVDLSASINPYGPHPRVLAAARAAAVERYPEPDARSLRTAYGARHGLPPDAVVAGNGSSELIYLAARAFAARGATVLVLGPTFGEYAAAARAAGAEVFDLAADEATGFVHDLDLAAREIASRRPPLTIVCNPNNPTGALVSRAGLEALTAASVAAGGRLLVDEAYGDFAFPRDERTTPAPGRAVLRSLTKLHAIPGLRLGFLLAEPGDARAVRRAQPPWAVSAPAAAAGLQALEETEFAEESRARVAAARDDLGLRLVAGGFAVTPSHANFLLVEVGEASSFRTRLLDHGFVARDCKSFGLPKHIRVAVPRLDQVAPLARALEECR